MIIRVYHKQLSVEWRQYDYFNVELFPTTEWFFHVPFIHSSRYMAANTQHNPSQVDYR